MINKTVNKKDFSWKWYLILVIISEIITVFFTKKLSFYYYSKSSHEMSEGLSYGIMCWAVWVLNSSIVFVSSVVEFIKYKKYRANGFNSAMNVIISILSSIMISIGLYGLNYGIKSIFSRHILLNNFFSSILYIVTGIALNFPIFISKK